MPRRPVPFAAWPVVGLSVLLTAACLAGTATVNRLQAELGDALAADAARLRAAQQAQIHLREYRVHTVLLASGPTPDRDRQVGLDRERFIESLADLGRLADGSDDHADLAEVRDGWDRYEAGLRADPPGAGFRTVGDLSAWADDHRVTPLLAPCGRLVERSQARMADATARGAAQTRWAGRTLLAVGLLGPLAGLLGGYAAARTLSRRVARLSVRVHAARSHLDHDAGAVTLDPSASLADLDKQLGTVVDRVGAVCRRVQQQGRELVRAEQLAAVGRLAAGVAHEVRNPLTGIKMLVEAALRPDRPAPLTDADLRLVRDEIARLERTVEGLLDYARPAPAALRVQDARPVLTRAVEVVAARADRAGVAVEFAPPAAPLFAPLDADRFTSLLTNLLINALEATPRGGRVRVEAGAAGGTISVAVSDTGPGVAPDLLPTLFTPFSTTKPAGTGLGLATARRAAVDHGGDLTAENRPGGGACFTLTLPAAENPDVETPGR